MGARRRPASAAGAAGAGDRRPRRGQPGRRDRVGGRRPRGLPPRSSSAQAGAVGHGTVRRPHRRAAQPRGAELRRRHRRHPAYRADAVVHGLAVGRLDRRAAPHRARRLELPTAALDTRFRLRAGLRRRRLAARRDPGPQRAVLPSAARPCARTSGAEGCRRSARCCTSSPPTSVQLAALKAAGNPLAAGSARPVDPGAVALRLVETTGASTRVAHRLGAAARCAALQLADLLEKPWKRRRTDRSTCTAIRSPPCWPRFDVPKVLDRTPPSWPRTPRPPSRSTRATGCTTAVPRRSVACRPSPTCIRSRLTGEPGSEVVLRLTAASDCSDAALDVERSRWYRRTAGRPHPSSCRSRCAPASTRRPTWR